jgi:hypothetical protein
MNPNATWREDGKALVYGMAMLIYGKELDGIALPSEIESKKAPAIRRGEYFFL